LHGGAEESQPVDEEAYQQLGDDQQREGLRQPGPVRREDYGRQDEGPDQPGSRR
jgi:hypothetical protein